MPETHDIHWKRISKWLLLYAFVFLVVGEILVRVLPVKVLGGVYGDLKINIKFDKTGPNFVPDQTARFASECFDAYPITINSHGFRGKEYEVAKQSDVFRIAVLGDSFMEALQINDGETTADQLETILQDNWQKTEVLNFGFSGTGAAQQLIRYRYTVKNFSPDLVLLFFLPGNDFIDSHMEYAYQTMGIPLDTYDRGEGTEFAYLVEESTGLVERLNRRTNSPLKQWLKDFVLHQSRLAGFMFDKLSVIRQKMVYANLEKAQNFAAKEPIDDRDEDSSDVQELAHETQKSSNENNALQDESVALTKKILELIRQEVIRDGADFKVVLIPGDSSVRLPAKQILTELEMNFLDLKPHFDQDMENNDLLYSDYIWSCDGHWNYKGHDVATAAVYEWILGI